GEEGNSFCPLVPGSVPAGPGPAQRGRTDRAIARCDRPLCQPRPPRYTDRPAQEPACTSPPLPPSRKMPEKPWPIAACRKPSHAAGPASSPAGLPEFEQLRDTARDIKNHTLANLDFYLEASEAKVRESGGIVHWCDAAAQARAVVLEICRKAGARTVTKGKSMIGEEIAINDHLEEHGIT